MSRNKLHLVSTHTQDFPPELIRCLSKDAMKFCFIQSLKEASQIKHKHNIVASMTSEEHAKLFDSICNGLKFAADSEPNRFLFFRQIQRILVNQ
jgi:hypothetical protein